MPCGAQAQQAPGAAGEGVPSAQAATVGAPNIAWFYGDKPPVAQLRAFDVVVVEPDHGFDPSLFKTPKTQWVAYVSVGEVTPERRWYKDLPKTWLSGRNKDWASRVVDQAQPDWPAFYVDHVIAPLWDKGYRGFFLDTLDSYQLVAKDDASRAAQEAGMVRVIRAIKARYPAAKLIFNRGFEILPQVRDLAYAVAFESLYRGWDQGARQYKEVSDADREWLMGQARKIRDEYRLPVIAIDYCPPADRACARETARRIKAQGLTPYVTDPELSTIGVGRIEVLPRGSIRYINERLAPADKRVKIVQWSGDCQPPDVAVRMAWAAGVVNINGGDTTIARSSPSWTDIAPLGLDKGPDAYQVFASNQNENVYTNDWTGPFDGFDRPIETLQMTDTPYRFKPINLDYHMYSGTKLAALKALNKVYDYALAQPVFPVYSTEYAAKVLDFRDMAVARDGDAWVVRVNGGPARTARAQDNTLRVDLGGIADQNVTYQRIDVVC